MTCDIRFLDVGNGDCIVIQPDQEPVVIVDVANPRKLFKVLGELGVTKVAKFFVTHGHADHVPSLDRFEGFLTTWLRAGNSLGALYLPRNLWAANLNHLEKIESSRPLDAARGRRALDRLDAYEGDDSIRITNADRGAGPIQVGDLVIEILHPSYRRQDTAATDKAKPNALSLVLRMEYGQFAAILLGDLEGPGITACLSLRPEKLRAHLVKIPHHGAWPTNGAELESLLGKIRPRLAILSVGSTNPYKHVAPELFAAMLDRQKSDGMKFVCTEITRTCERSATARTTMGDSGLSAVRECAGDIHIVARKGGELEHIGREAHLKKLDAIPHAACTPRADLGLVPTAALKKRAPKEPPP